MFFLLNSRHSVYLDFRQSAGVVDFFGHRYQHIYSHLCFFLSDTFNVSLKALVCNSFVSFLRNRTLCFKGLQEWILLQLSQCMKNQRKNNGLQLSILCPILRFMCDLSGNMQDLGLYKYANHILVHIMANL